MKYNNVSRESVSNLLSQRVLSLKPDTLSSQDKTYLYYFLLNNKYISGALTPEKALKAYSHKCPYIMRRLNEIIPLISKVLANDDDMVSKAHIRKLSKF